MWIQRLNFVSNSQALAQQLQAEEDEHARRLYIQQEKQRQRKGPGTDRANKQDKVRKKPSCVIM